MDGSGGFDHGEAYFVSRAEELVSNKDVQKGRIGINRVFESGFLGDPIGEIESSLGEKIRVEGEEGMDMGRGNGREEFREGRVLLPIGFGENGVKEQREIVIAWLRVYRKR